MFKKCFPILMVFFYVLVNIQPIVCFTMYGVNYDYISNVLCINKDRTDLEEECQGKCYLTKELEKAESQTQVKINIDNLLPHEMVSESSDEQFWCIKNYINFIPNPSIGFTISFTPPPQQV